MSATITTSQTDVQERLSLAYLFAVAARAGCEILEPKVDRNCIDAIIRPISGAAVQIDVQMKATSQDLRLATSPVISFPLEVNRYDLLRRTDAIMPQLLLVYEMPPTPALWLNINSTETTLRHLAYWVDLRSEPAVTSSTTQVHVPLSNRFDSAAILDIMDRAYSRAKLGLTWA